jgi:hypothetical protein
MNVAASQSVYTRRILWQLSLITVPMIASSVVVIWIVHANLVSESRPDEALGPQTINETYEHYYLIDFPAARLAFISSWSATISFALLGVLMAIYSYVNAAAYLRVSEKKGHESLPGSNDTTMLLRLLNAEFTAFFELVFATLKSVFWHLDKTESASRTPRLLTNCSTVFAVGIIVRFEIQGSVK